MSIKLNVCVCVCVYTAGYNLPTDYIIPPTGDHRYSHQSPHCTYDAFAGILFYIQFMPIIVSCVICSVCICVLEFLFVKRARCSFPAVWLMLLLETISSAATSANILLSALYKRGRLIGIFGFSSFRSFSVTM